MTKTPIEELLKQCASIYKLVVVSAKRAKELADGSPKIVETSSKKITTVALEEICQGKVIYNDPERQQSQSAGTKSRKRATKEAGARATAEKKRS